MAPPVAYAAYSQKINLAFLRIAGVHAFGIRYTRAHKCFFCSEAIIHDPRHVLHQQVKDRLNARDRNTLWWNVSSNTMVAKKVVRSWMSRRLRVAVLQALRAHGLDGEGRAVQAGVQELRGTLQFHTLQPIMTARLEDVRAQVGLVIRELRERERKFVKVPPNHP